MWKVSRNSVLEHIYAFPEPFGTLLWRIPEANFQTFIRSGRPPAGRLRKSRSKALKDKVEKVL